MILLQGTTTKGNKFGICFPEAVKIGEESKQTKVIGIDENEEPLDWIVLIVKYTENDRKNYLIMSHDENYLRYKHF